MHEFDTVSVSSFEAASLAGKLTERSADGWDVVAIVPAGSEVTAYLRRESTGSASTGEVATEPAAADGVVADAVAADTITDAEPQEPAGWGSAPAAAGTGWGSSNATAAETPATSTATSTPAGTTSSWDTGATAATTPAATASPQVPPGWYADPSGRYELRYWDGAAWTEHVARQGQQYTDPPVA